MADGGGSLVLRVPAARHGRRSPVASVFVRSTDGLGFEEVVVAVAAAADGTLELSVGDSDQVRSWLYRGEVRIT
jgi:plasmid stability protein